MRGAGGRPAERQLAYTISTLAETPALSHSNENVKSIAKSTSPDVGNVSPSITRKNPSAPNAATADGSRLVNSLTSPAGTDAVATNQ